jgi:hypothetical protein
MNGKISSVKLLSAATATGAGESHSPWTNFRTFQAVGRTTAGAGGVDADVEGSNDGINWIDLGTITLVLSTTDSTDGFASDAAWRYVRANVTSISGTGASVDVWLGA